MTLPERLKLSGGFGDGFTAEDWAGGVRLAIDPWRDTGADFDLNRSDAERLRDWLTLWLEATPAPTEA